MEMNKEFILNELTSYSEYDTQKLYDMDEKSISDLFNLTFSLYLAIKSSYMIFQVKRRVHSY